ncbi:MAG: site-2 protease family protein [Verrucomicrobiota bacterium]
MSKPNSGIFLGRLFGIRFYIDYSWFLIAAIVTYSLSTAFFPAYLPGCSPPFYFILGTVAALLFFLSILLHELGHSVVSQRCGIPVPRITLLFIGGIAEISREPDNPKMELKIALAGPAVTVFLVVVYYLLSMLFSHFHMAGISLLFQWLGEVNLFLVIFNAIPGYPLDGGRVLRAILWGRSGNIRRATYLTSRIGVGFSWVLIVLGVIALFNKEWSALTLLIIGIFLKTAAESGYQQALYHEVLAGVRVRDIMSKNPVCIPSRLPVNLAVDDFFLANHHVAFPVVDDENQFQGMLQLEDLKHLPREKWPFTAAGDLVSAQELSLLEIPAGEPADKAMRRLLIPGQGRLAVTEQNQLTGIITRHDILKFIKIHTELEA